MIQQFQVTNYLTEDMFYNKFLFWLRYYNQLKGLPLDTPYETEQLDCIKGDKK